MARSGPEGPRVTEQLRIARKRIVELEVENLSLRQKTVPDPGRATDALERSEQRYWTGNVEAINELAIRCAAADQDQDLFAIIAEGIKGSTGAVAVGITTYDRDACCLSIQHLTLDEDALATIDRYLGRKLSSFQFRVTPDLLDTMISDPVTTLADLSSVTLGMIPDSVGRDIEERVGIGSFTTLALVYNEELLGTTVIALGRDQPPIPPGMARTLASVIAVSLRRKRAEDALRESEALYRGLVDSAVVGVFQCTTGGEFLYANNAAIRLAGCHDFKELAARKVRDYCRNLHDLKRFIIRMMRERAAITSEVSLIPMTSTDRTAQASVTLNGSVISGIVLDVSVAKDNLDALESAQSRLRHLSHRLLQAQESERGVIARELHDEVGQILTTAKVDLQMISEKPISRNSAERVRRSVEAIDGCLERIRNLTLGLRPSMLDDLGLVVTLRWLTGTLSKQFRLAILFQTEELPGRLEADIETVCYRVCQEALTNVARHSHATNVVVYVRLHEQEFLASITDNGVGFDVEEAEAGATVGRSFGLLGMHERAALVNGRVEFKSDPKHGTTVTLRLPLRFAAN